MPASNTALHLSSADQQEEVAPFSVNVCLPACFLRPLPRRSPGRPALYATHFPQCRQDLARGFWNGILALPLGSYLTSQTSDSTRKMMTPACFGCLNERISVAFSTRLDEMFVISLITTIVLNPSLPFSALLLRRLFQVPCT